MGAGDEEQARTAITDQGGVSLPGSGDKLFVTDSTVEVGDLLCEGVLEGITSGKYTYAGTKGQTGFYSTGFAPYTASGTALNQDPELGFLRSVYWNDVPVVDVNGYYNFADVNLEYVKGEPVGNLPSLSSKLPANETVDLTVHRPIGERLYGISIQGGTEPTIEKPPAWLAPDGTWSTSLPSDKRIDAVAKTYTILNKECTSLEVRIRIPALWEQIRDEDAPKKHEVDKDPPPVGYGDTKARSVEYLVYWQPVFDERFDGVMSTADTTAIEKIKGTWEGPHSEVVTGKISETYIRNTTINLQSNYTSQYGFDGWRIKIIRITPESLTAYLQMTTYVDSLTEIYGTKLRYPYSSMVYSKFSAEYFTRVPARSYDTKLLKVLIPNNYHPIKKTYGASDALTMTSDTKVTAKVEILGGMKVYFENGAVFTCGMAHTIGAGATNVTLTDKGSIVGTVTTGETGATVEAKNNASPATASTNFWDGGFRYTREWTDNPAWCFYDLLTNARYGLGDHIDKSQVDKWALYEIAQYCDVLVPDGYGSIEPRFAINHIITSREEAYKVLNDMASIFRGLAYYSNGLIYAVQDAFKNPVYQFNNANVIDGNFTYSSSAKKTRHSVALVRYIDKRNFFQPSVEYVENEESIKRYGIRQLETTALGCTSRGQARRFGLWMLASEFQETESVAFSVGQDGGYLKPGDVLQLYDQHRTPLKFGGRTNAVLATGVAPSTLTYESLPVTGNSIIIDNAISFNDKYYKFSLLTPTYYYDTVDIGDNLDSSDINQIRRSQIQDLYFYGPHAQTVTGYYRSDYNVGGSGVATQIYFHTGLKVDGVGPIGTGNQLDFENYVITGYTNDYVQGNTEVSYSGGCFSGENLIWSIEPNDPADDEFISGNFSTYRVINVAENDDSDSYNVSALAYSSGKYEGVEGRLSFASPNIVKPPVWPYLETLGTAGYSALATVRKGHPNKETEEGERVPTSEADFLKYPTIEVRFPQAGFDYIKDPITGEPAPLPVFGGAFSYVIDPDTANPKGIRYLICVKRDSTTDGNGFQGQTFSTVFTNGASMAYISVPSNTNNFKDYYAPNQFKYIDGDVSTAYAEGTQVAPNNNSADRPRNPYVIVPNVPEGNRTLHEFLFEFLADEDTSFWVAIFAVNNNIVSENAYIGLIPGSKANTSNLGKILDTTNKLTSTDVFSTVEFRTISALTSENAQSPFDDNIVELKSTEPSFSWAVGDKRNIYDDLGNRLFIPSPYNNYRITIRNNETAVKDEVGQGKNDFDDIFIELTGYHSPADTANFVFLRKYNDPNMIESLVGNPDASGYNSNGEWVSDKANAAWFKVETSGVIFRNSPNSFPLRNFELVVEAHDSAGTTSAGNKVWDNTLRPNSTEHYPIEEEAGWDLFAGKLAVPSGIIFGTAPLRANNEQQEGEHIIGNNGFLLPEQAYLRNYPYLATAAVYADGTLNLRMEESRSSTDDVILDSNQISDAFSEVAGIVYYFTTGDNTLIDVEDGGVITFNNSNLAPLFTIQRNNIPNSINLGNMAINKKVPNLVGNMQRQSTAVADTGEAKAELEALPWDNTTQYDAGTLVSHGGYVWKALIENQNVAPVFGTTWRPYWMTTNVAAFRNFALLEGKDPANITIPFPAIGDPRVSNIHLCVALFDKLSLLRYFKSDGVTPKRETVTTANSNPAVSQNIPLLFTDDSLNFSTLPQKIMPSAESQWSPEETALDDKSITAEGRSLPLKELSIVSSAQGAGSYKAWFDFEIQPENDFDANGVWKGTRYKNDGVFYNRGYKSKNIKQVTLEIPSKNVAYMTSTAWPNVKIPEYGYLTIEFAETLNPQKYWVDVEFNQTGSTSDSTSTVGVTDADGNDYNQNSKDYIIKESNPKPTAYLMEKSQTYVKMFIAPFVTRAITLSDNLDITDGREFWLKIITTLEKIDPTQHNPMWTPDGSLGGDSPRPLYNTYEGSIATDDPTKTESLETIYKLTGKVNNIVAVSRVPDTAEDGNGYKSDFSSHSKKSIKLTHIYYLSSNGGISYDKNFAVKGLELPILEGTNFTAANKVAGVFRNDMYVAHSVTVNVKSESTSSTSDNPFLHSTPLIEEYAYKQLGNKSYTEQSVSKQASEPHALPLNIKIQGGILMSDEYIPPVLP
jgi:hypothetical protein